MLNVRPITIDVSGLTMASSSGAKPTGASELEPGQENTAS